jgi:hypothetical protein
MQQSLKVLAQDCKVSTIDWDAPPVLPFATKNEEEWRRLLARS